MQKYDPTLLLGEYWERFPDHEKLEECFLVQSRTGRQNISECHSALSQREIEREVRHTPGAFFDHTVKVVHDACHQEPDRILDPWATLLDALKDGTSGFLNQVFSLFRSIRKPIARHASCDLIACQGNLVSKALGRIVLIRLPQMEDVRYVKACILPSLPDA